jgi:hypothetical protein
VTGSVDETVKTWRASGDACEETHTYTGHALGVVSVAVDAQVGAVRDGERERERELWVH